MNQISLAHRGASSGDEPKDGARCGVPRRPVRNHAAGARATAGQALWWGGARTAASDQSAAANVRALRVKTATVGAPRGWPSLRREGCQRLASVGVPDVFGTLFYPGAPLGAPSAPRSGWDTISNPGRKCRGMRWLFDIVRKRRAD